MFVSADEKFGVELLLADEVPPADDVSEEPIELELDEDGVDELEDGVLLEEDDGVLDEVDGELDDEDDCATASVDSAKSTAAVMMLRDLGMDGASSGLKRTAPSIACKACAAAPVEGPAVALRATRQREAGYSSWSVLPFFFARQVLAPAPDPVVSVISSPSTLPSIGMVRPPALKTPFSIWKSCVMLNSPCGVL